MAEERRTGRTRGRPSRGAAGRTGGAGRARSGPGGPRPTAQTVQRRQDQRQKVAAAAAAKENERAEEKRRTRLTGRAAILVLVLAVLAVSYASSMRAYLQQRSQINQLQAQIDDSKSAIADLEQEKERWQDSAYVAQQARERFGYVARGETPYVVVDENGDPLDATSSLADPDSVGSDDERTWYDDMWDSMKIAGDPPTQVPDPPAEEIEPSQQDLGE